MKKILSLVLLTFLVTTAALAVRPLRVLFPQRQSDGTTVMVYRHGDGHSGVVFYSTEDGLALVRNSAGDLCYAFREGSHLRASTVVAHNADERTESERTFVRQEALMLEQAYQATSMRSRKLNRIASGGSGKRDGLGKLGTTAGGAVNSIGAPVIPVVMVSFKDVDFEYATQEKLQALYNQEGYTDSNGSVGSARDYFTDQSNGIFRPDFRVVANVKLNKTQAEYGKDDGDDIDVNLEDFVVDAVAAARKAGVKFSDYVNSAEKGVPCCIFIYAGEGEANSYADNSDDFLWPCEFDYDYDAGDNTMIRSFFVGNEMKYSWTYAGNGVYSRKNPKMEGIGTFCHEFGHALGLPDFYCTDYSHDTSPFGYWDIMDMGSYLNDGYAPIGHTAYEKNFLGWLDLYETQNPEAVTLYPLSADTGYNAMLVRNAADDKEYYVFENRQAGKWYPAAMSGGMLGLHVAFDRNLWEDNVLNNDETELHAHIFAADGSTESPYSASPNYKSDLFPGSKNVTKIQDSGSPAMKAYTGSYMSKPLYGIALNADGTITFNYLLEVIPKLVVGDTVVIDGLTYVADSYSTLLVAPSEGDPYEGDIVIPAEVEYEGTVFSVVGIGEDAFASCPALTSVTLGENVKTIAAGSFRHSTALSALSSGESPYFETVDGALYTNRELVGAPEAASSLFDFAKNTMNLPTSSSGSESEGNITAPLTIDGVTMTAAHGSTATRLWKSGSTITLRVYKSGGALTFSAPSGCVIKQISFSATNFMFNVSTGTLNSTTKIWTGEAESVTFSAQSRCDISSVTIDYEKPGETQWKLVQAPLASRGQFTVADGADVVLPYALADGLYGTLVLPRSLTELGTASLSLPNLTALYAQSAVPASPQSASTGAGGDADPFGEVDKAACKLYVPADALSTYASAMYWRDFLDRAPITEIPTAIGSTFVPQRASGAVYDLQGRLVARPSRGVYIVNGRKVIR